jgi:hypothetical protein
VEITLIKESRYYKREESWQQPISSKHQMNNFPKRTKPLKNSKIIEVE